jgi:hypothetical protein
MKNIKPVWHSLGHSILVLLYVSGVAGLLYNAQRIFGQAQTFWVPVAMLMLFVLSATIVGILVLGRPILLYVSGQKKEGLQFLGYTVAWLFVLTLIAFAAIHR